MVSKDLYMQLRSLAGRVSLLYGLPKVHKQAVPFRPIVSFVTSHTYQLSKFLVSVLAPLVGRTSTYVRNCNGIPSVRSDFEPCNEGY